MTKSGPPSRNGLPRAASRCAVLLAVAAAASWLPARRAARVDPARTLRGD